MPIYFQLLKEGARLPTRAHPGDAGLDLYAPKDVIIPPLQAARIPLGLAVELPRGTVGLIAERSSIATANVFCLGRVIDCGYRDEISVILFNLNQHEVDVEGGSRVAQLIVTNLYQDTKTYDDYYSVPCDPIVIDKDRLAPSSRGNGGFGSTGK